jgi:hypothetical protein
LVFSICVRICAQRSSIAFFLPAPPTMIVRSLLMLIALG